MNTKDIKNMYRHDFSSFVRFSHQILNPYAVYLDNWHMQVMAEILTRIAQGEMTRLIINVPPRMGKSLCASIAFPAWVLGRDPAKKILCLSGGKTLGHDLHESCEVLMGSRRYKSLFGHLRLKAEPGRLLTGHGGYRLYMPIEAKMTGLGGDIVIMDDPIDAMRAQDDGERRRLNEQFDQNIIQRLNDKKTGAIILVMQRVHENDLTAHLLSKNEGWVHINMPAIAFQDETWQLPHGQVHVRKKFEALAPARESVAQLADILRSIGGYAFAYQYLQGLYKPRFGKESEGCIWITPQREGDFWDGRKNKNAAIGFFKYREEDLILPKVFGIGSDPCPPDMRKGLTDKEWEWAYAGVKFDPETGKHTYPEDFEKPPFL